jgi:phosphoadenosine phosphosulfate reductase
MREAHLLGQAAEAVDGEILLRAAERFESAPPQEVLHWAVSTYGAGLTVSVSFGNPEGMVLLDMLSRINGETRVFTLDTGFLFQETVGFREEAMRHYPLPIEVVTPEITIEEQVERYGPQMYTCAPGLCCEIRKVRPQKRFLEGYDAWVTGIRRDQTPQRAGTPVVVYDEFFGVAKIAPLARWSAEQVEEYVVENDVPLNPLISRGYRSIGCEPCTRPVAPGEDARAGRWAGTGKTECGIHIVGGAPIRETMVSVRRPTGW